MHSSILYCAWWLLHRAQAFVSRLSTLQEFMRRLSSRSNACNKVTRVPDLCRGLLRALLFRNCGLQRGAVQWHW